MILPVDQVAGGKHMPVLHPEILLTLLIMRGVEIHLPVGPYVAGRIGRQDVAAKVERILGVAARSEREQASGSEERLKRFHRCREHFMITKSPPRAGESEPGVAPPLASQNPGTVRPDLDEVARNRAVP